MIFIFGEVVRVAACGGPPDERMRIVGLRCREAAARAVLRTAFSFFAVLFADGGRSATAVRRSGATANCAVLKNRNIHMRQPNPRQKRFRTKGGRDDGALRIGDLLIASKVPKASDSA